MYPFHNNANFYSEELLAPCPTPKLEDEPLSAVHGWLNMFAANLHISQHSSNCELFMLDWLWYFVYRHCIISHFINAYGLSKINMAPHIEFIIWVTPSSSIVLVAFSGEYVMIEYFLLPDRALRPYWLLHNNTLILSMEAVLGYKKYPTQCRTKVSGLIFFKNRRHTRKTHTFF